MKAHALKYNEPCSMSAKHKKTSLSYEKHGDFDSESLSRDLETLIQRAEPELLLDLSRIEYFNSLEMSYIARFIRDAREKKKHVEVRLKPHVAEGFELVGFTVSKSSEDYSLVDFL